MCSRSANSSTLVPVGHTVPFYKRLTVSSIDSLWVSVCIDRGWVLFASFFLPPPNSPGGGRSASVALISSAGSSFTPCRGVVLLRDTHAHVHTRTSSRRQAR